MFMLCYVMLCCAFVPLATSVFRLPLSRCSSCTCTSALGLGVAIPTLHYGVHYNNITTSDSTDREEKMLCCTIQKQGLLPAQVGSPYSTVCRRSPDEKRNHVNLLLISLVRSTPYRMEPEKAGAKNTYPQLLQSHVWLVCKSIF